MAKSYGAVTTFGKGKPSKDVEKHLGLAKAHADAARDAAEAGHHDYAEQHRAQSAEHHAKAIDLQLKIPSKEGDKAEGSSGGGGNPNHDDQGRFTSG